MTVTPMVVAVHLDRRHGFSKQAQSSITLVAGLGVEGDAHSGATVKHRSRVAVNPDQPNLRQVHLIHGELFDQLTDSGFEVGPGDLGENITTRGVDLLALATGTMLRIGENAILAITGLRNPCSQIDRFQPGLRARLVEHGPGRQVVRKAGVMAVVVRGGVVRPNQSIRIAPPAGPPSPLEVV